MKSPLAPSGTLPEIAVSFAAQATTEPQVFPQAKEPLAAAGLSMLPGSSAAWAGSLAGRTRPCWPCSAPPLPTRRARSRDLFSSDKPRR